MRNLFWLAASLAFAQGPPPPTYIPQTKFDAGQNVVPVFEGWLRNTDGSFTMVFGYFNRNFKEELVIPAGPDNKIEPGEADRGQPTYFLPRRQPWVFRVPVPKDWGQKELVWTLTSHGRTEKAYAQLLPVEEITERIIMTRGNLNPGDDDPNKPPSITIAPPGAASLTSPLTLTALVTDDGLPKPRAPVKPRPGAQSNTVDNRPRGLNVSWMQYRGPAKATFDASGPMPVADGKAVTTVRFIEPGTYVLRATANDGQLSTKVDLTVTVKPDTH
ncbi:MAG: hypothetical protein C5B51_28695 [Terriglobia bacterium]|nr:MAG: hypothetical protein C5B51_28695 [Terriglobia bacterium]